jgi:hypothetical protein
VPAFADNDERVTCSSCRFRYSRSRGFCPICGSAAAVDQAACETRRVGKEAVVGLYETGLTIGQRVRKALALIVKNPVLVVVPIALICALYFWIVRSGRMPKQGASASVVPATSPEPQTRSATVPESAPQPAVPATVSFPGTTPAAKKTVEIADDPVQLWKRVQRGNTGAEIELAKLYLDGVRVAQNCEQARLLLLAASKKGSTVASNLLSGAYSQRCR